MMIIVDVESDGPCPVDYSMVCFGAVVVEDTSRTFFGRTAPLPGAKWDPQALAVSGHTREEHLTFMHPETTMLGFEMWLTSLGKTKYQFISDNPAFDWQWINYYFHHFVGHNPFGFSARRIGDFYAGLVKNWRCANDWKSLRVTEHTHHPVDDAKGNAEALMAMAHKYSAKLLKVEST